ncbi:MULTISPECIES: hypothetical protein [Desulfurella]|uniref:hypothetical protein n=1 Tax=Desulfurella TaxID=33001 RepID=UPI000CC92137|nr:MULTISPECIES: hypothetical protein [Desulfurella]PMP68654.1 MAG: hypothetical protein C0192_01480 [Desulfurella multipotens]PMP88327.1 MAG: hypothetical protein C0173_07420 [Desulfurella sp.]PMP93721.1 MAG: hypothetical protein C0173_00030 [Desulfurella sp.]HEX13202.1 hypothetical protein [Desulfurella acetivorans]
MYYLKKALLSVFIVSVFSSFSIIFYRYTLAKLNILNQAMSTLSSYQNKISTVKQKLSVLKRDESIIKGIDTKLKTNFKINLSENSLIKLVEDIDSLYSSGMVVIKDAKIQSSNGTLNCTIEGFRWGL